MRRVICGLYRKKEKQKQKKIKANFWIGSAKRKGKGGKETRLLVLLLGVVFFYFLLFLVLPFTAVKTSKQWKNQSNRLKILKKYQPTLEWKI